MEVQRHRPAHQGQQRGRPGQKIFLIIQVDQDLLVVALSRAGEVVAHVLDGFGLVAEVSEVDHVFGTHEASAGAEEGGGVAVDIGGRWGGGSR